MIKAVISYYLTTRALGSVTFCYKCVFSWGLFICFKDVCNKESSFLRASHEGGGTWTFVSIIFSNNNEMIHQRLMF